MLRYTLVPVHRLIDEEKKKIDTKVRLWGLVGTRKQTQVTKNKIVEVFNTETARLGLVLKPMACWIRSWRSGSGFPFATPELIDYFCCLHNSTGTVPYCVLRVFSCYFLHVLRGKARTCDLDLSNRRCLRCWAAETKIDRWFVLEEGETLIPVHNCKTCRQHQVALTHYFADECKHVSGTSVRLFDILQCRTMLLYRT
jgi:hypothetical protein